MNKKEPFYKLSFLIAIFLFLLPFAAMMPFSARGEIQMNKPCADPKNDSLQQQQSKEKTTYEQIECLPAANNTQITMLILGIINIEDLTMWVLGVDRRLIVLKMMQEERMIQASDIADSTGRSLQNISYAMRELEKQGLIRCITPDKHTWKKYIPTERGIEVFSLLKKNNFLGK
ncbi:MAG: winged helix-turn-helix domain-containing protein [Candidatus Methanoperedens sp.]|nr:winged helix-turn-helix domain-containing protein [Candidatus Methanoperedens sp.]